MDLIWFDGFIQLNRARVALTQRLFWLNAFFSCWLNVFLGGFQAGREHPEAVCWANFTGCFIRNAWHKSWDTRRLAASCSNASGSAKLDQISRRAADRETRLWPVIPVMMPGRRIHEIINNQLHPITFQFCVLPKIWSYDALTKLFPMLFFIWFPCLRPVVSQTSSRTSVSTARFRSCTYSCIAKQVVEISSAIFSWQQLEANSSVPETLR